MPPKQKALEKQEQLEAARAQKAAEDAERAEAAAWSVGAKDSARNKEMEEKDAAKRAKAAEKAALLAQENEELGSIVKVKTAKKKVKDDFDMLNAALAKQPKTKLQKEADAKIAAKKKADEERKKKEDEVRAEREAKAKAESDYIKKQAARGIVVNHTDDLFIPINNRLPDEDDEDFEESARGLDAAVGVMSLVTGAKGKVDEHPERRQKALYNAYFEDQLPVWKVDYPGLKLSQYKDRIFEAWKKAPENPHNQAFLQQMAQAQAQHEKA